MKKYFFLTALLGFVLIFDVRAQDTIKNPENIKFIEYLFLQNLYEEAALELENIVFKDNQNDTLFYLLLKSYRMSEQYEKGLNRARQIEMNIYTMPENSAFEYLLLMLKNNERDSAALFLGKYNFKSDSLRNQFQIHLNIMDKKWTEAKTIINKENRDDLNCYHSLINDGMNLKYKKPIIAGGLSTIIPGSGKIYAGYKMDGITAFISIAGLAYQSYSGFKRDGENSVYGWVFAGIGGVFYLSNIYGSAKSAKQINRYNEDKILRKLDACLDNY